MISRRLASKSKAFAYVNYIFKTFGFSIVVVSVVSNAIGGSCVDVIMTWDYRCRFVLESHPFKYYYSFWLIVVFKAQAHNSTTIGKPYKDTNCFALIIA